MFYNKKIFILLIIFFHTNLPAQAPNKDHTITVFVHETFPMRKLLHHTPGKPLVYTEQGLCLAKKLPSNYHFYKIAQGCIELNSHDYGWDRFYTFGWKSEKILNRVRKNAAKDLVHALAQVVDSYYVQHGVHPSIRLIGFSHGGNVILHTANYLPLVHNTIKIDVEAWIFGTPIQQANHDCVNQGKFTQCYSFYSEKDWIQRIDPQGLCNKKIRKDHFWSDRTFNKDASCIQVKFTVNDKPISHIYYRSIFKYFPIIEQITQSQSDGLQSGMIAVDVKI